MNLGANTWQQAQRWNRKRFSVEAAKGYAGSTVYQAHLVKWSLVSILLTKRGTSARAAPKYSLSCTPVNVFL